MELFIDVQHGNIILADTLTEKLKNLPDSRYKITIKKHNKRSLSQNAYYHGVIVPIVKDGLREAGFDGIKTDEDAHEAIKYLFLQKTIKNSLNGESIELLGSTKELSTTEFIQFVADIQKWAAEYLNTIIPDPE